LIAPVRFRAVASGLMIEKVRSTAIVLILCKQPAHDPAREGGGLIAAEPKTGKFAALRQPPPEPVLAPERRAPASL
jgi:hypothetical protein